MIVAITMLCALLAAHALCDYPLQGDFLARAKNRTAPIPGVPWWQALGAHAAIHGGAVGWITGVWWLGLCEAIVHFVTDDLKCRGRLTFNQDQAIHALCKAAWVIIAALLLTGCAHTEPRVVYRDVQVPISVPCRVEEPEKPSYAADQVDLAAPLFDLVKALLVDREQRKATETELRAAVKSCS